jgi:hypothetical protein
MSDTTFKFDGRASAFVTRDVGRQIREQLLDFERQIPESERVVIDASGIEALTPSFVDEFFGRTASLFGLERFRNRFRIEGVDQDSKLLINKVVRNRLILDAQATSLTASSDPAS